MNITLECVGNLLSIFPWVPELATELVCRRRIKNAFGFQFDVEDLYYTITNGNGTKGFTYGGFRQRVTNRLRTLGHTVEVIDYQKLLPDPEWNLIPALRHNQDRIIASIISSHRGLVAVPTAMGKSFLITTFCRIYPNLKFLIITPRKAVTEMLYKGVKENGSGVVARLFGPRQEYPDNAQVIVSTTKSMHKVSPDWPDIVFFDEAHGAAAPGTAAILAEYGKAKLFGLTASPYGRSDAADKLTEAFFGQVICNIEYQEAVSDGVIADIEVHIADVNMPEVEFETDVEAERYGYWLNERRTRIMVDKARELLSPSDQTLFFVKTAEHGLALRRLLPGVPLVHSGIGRKQWDRFCRLNLVQSEEYDSLAKVKPAQLQKAFEAGEIPWMIATTIWKEGVDFLNLKGLVRMDGEGGPISSTQIPGRLSRRGSDGEKRVGYLIDSYDNFGSRFLNRSRKRLREYRKKGWRIVR